MKSKCIDLTGRLVIPQPVRNAVGINPWDALDIYAEGDRIIIKKLNPYCVFCGNEENLSVFSGKKVCKNCLDAIKRG